MLTLDASTLDVASARVEYRLEVAQFPFKRDGLGFLEVLRTNRGNAARIWSWHMNTLSALREMSMGVALRKCCV